MDPFIQSMQMAPGASLNSALAVSAPTENVQPPLGNLAVFPGAPKSATEKTGPAAGAGIPWGMVFVAAIALDYLFDS
jgi:hypothetical protein